MHEKINYDIENILTYNVGTRPFDGLMYNGILLERSFQNVQCSATDKVNASQLATMNHHMCYQMISPTTTSMHWEEGETLGRWSNVYYATSCNSVHGFWSAIEKGEFIKQDMSKSGFYGIELSLKVPNKRQNLLYKGNRLKHLLDALIASCHAYIGDYLEGISKWLAIRTGDGIASIRNSLVSESRNVLGQYELLRYNSKSGRCFWNPRDNDCMMIKILVEEEERTDVELSGELFTVYSDKYEDAKDLKALRDAMKHDDGLRYDFDEVKHTLK